MVYFIEANTMNAAFSAAVERIAACGGKKLIIVPDRFTLSAEKEIMKALSLSATFEIEVTSFTRLAAKTLSARERENVLSPQGTVLLMQKAVSGVRDQLKCYKSAAAFAGFSREVYAVVSDLRNHSVSAEQLFTASDTLDEYVKAKTRDVATLFDAYLKLSAGRYDESGKLEKLLRVLPDSQSICDSSVFIYDFCRFTGIERKILEKLFLHAKSVTVALAVGAGRLKTDTLSKLAASAAQLGVKCERARAQEKLPEGKREMSRYLFSYEKPLTPPQNAPALFEAQSKEEEMERVCESIALGVRSGMRYRDFAVVMGDREAYESVAQTVFSRYEIPYYLDKHYALVSLSPAAFLIAGQECAAGGFQKEKVLNFLKNPLFDEPFEVKDEYENYLRKYAKFGKKFNVPAVAEMEKIHARILSLGKIFRRQKARAEEFCEECREFLKAFDVERGNENLSAYMRQRKEEVSGVNERAFEKLCALLDETARVLSGEPMRSDAFFVCLKAALASAELSSVPYYADTVFIGDAEESRYGEVKRMYLVGANQGRFPLTRKREGILGKNEEEALARAGISLDPLTQEQSVFDKFYLTQLCLIPDALEISWLSGRGAFASLLAEEIKRIFAVKPQKARKGERVFARGDAQRKLAENLGALASGLDCSSRTGALLKTLEASYRPLRQSDFIDNGKELFFGKNAVTKVSELENYAICPYRHFLEYGLKLKERQEGEMRPTDTGSILHELLELFFKEGYYREMKEREADGVCAALLKRICEKEPYSFVLEGNEEAMRLLQKEGSFIIANLGRLSKLSAFEPAAFEYEFGFQKREIELGGKSGAALRGKVDRIDCLGDRVAVIDYKTGRSDGSLKHVYYGKKLQLYLYLGAIEKLWNARPAGVFYLGVNDKYEKEEDAQKRFRYKGQFLNDMETIRNFDASLSETKTVSEILPVSFNKNFEIDKRCKNALEEEDFAAIATYALKEAALFADEIAMGYKGKKPLKENGLACAYCPYEELCAQGKEKTPRTLSSAGLTEIIEAVRDNA